MMAKMRNMMVWYGDHDSEDEVHAGEEEDHQGKDYGHVCQERILKVKMRVMTLNLFESAKV